MHKKLAVLALIVTAFASCVENPPPVNLGKDKTVIQNDTIYKLSEANIPNADPQNILIEDMTGVRCSNCPKASKAAKAVKDTFGDRVVILGLYSTSPDNLTWPFSGYEDLRRPDAQLIGTNIYNFQNQLPAGGVNRRLFAGQSSLNYDYKLWMDGAIQLYHENSIVNLQLTKEQVDDTTFNIGAKITFTSTPDYDPFVSIALLEEGIPHPQTQPTGVDDMNYIHYHVMRTMYTPYNGEPIFKTGDIEPERGVVVERVWQIVVPDYVDVNKASVALFLNYNDANSKEVLQCMEIELK